MISASLVEDKQLGITSALRRKKCTHPFGSAELAGGLPVEGPGTAE
jgi:hypothetical protein